MENKKETSLPSLSQCSSTPITLPPLKCSDIPIRTAPLRLWVTKEEAKAGKAIRDGREYILHISNTK